MQERPDKLVLLGAISRFLVEEVRPALTDSRLSFRALIAAHLAHVVATELVSDDAAVTRELARLGSLFPDLAAGSSLPAASEPLESRRARVVALNRRLAAMLREESPAAAELAKIAAVLRESLREKLAIENPRFDVSMDIE